MQGGIKRFPYEQDLIEFPDDAKVLKFRDLYNLSVKTGAQAEFQKLARETLTNKADVGLFKRYKLDVPAYMKSIAERQAASSTKLQELEATQKVLASEIKGHQEAIAKQDAIIADARRQQDDALATQFATQMNISRQPPAVPSTNPTSAASKKKVGVI